jgi:hypothetical protein
MRYERKIPINGYSANQVENLILNALKKYFSKEELTIFILMILTILL